MADERLGASFSIDVTQLKAGLAQANRLIRQSESEFRAAAAGMDDWSKSEEGLTKRHDALSEQIDIQKKKIAALSDEKENIIQTMKAEGKSQEEIDRATDGVNQQITRESKALDKLKNELNKTDAALDELKTSNEDAAQSFEDVESAAGKLDDGFSVMKGTLADLISNGIQMAVGAIRGLVDEAISSSDALYKFEQTMGFAGYDDKTIKKAKTDMKDYADKTVYDLDTISNTTAQLAANGIDDFTGLTQAAGNLNAVAGGNADTFGSVAMMLTQTAGAGKLTTENWNQLADAIPGASGKLQESLKKAGAYTGDFREAMAKGEITSDEFNAAIMELGNDPIAVEAAKSVETFEGAVGNMQATVVNGLMGIIDTIGMENITGFINKATDGIEWIINNLPMVATLIGGITAAIAAQNAVTKIKIAMDTAQAAGTTLVAAAQNKLNLAMKANMIGIVIVAITALVAAFMYLWKNCEGFRNFWIKLWDGIKKTAKAAWDGIKKIFSVVGSWFKTKFTEAYNAIKSVFNKLPSFFKGLWGRIKSTFSSLGTKIGSAIGGAVKSAINGVITLIERQINSAISLINGAIGLINKIPKVHVGTVSKLHLPRMAQGGVVNKATNAIIGEDGAEAVVPLERNTEWIDKVADKVAEKTSGGGVVVNQTNNYSQAHSRYEIYKSKQQTAAAVRLAMKGV